VSLTHARQIFRAALAAADPVRAVLDHVQCDERALVADGQRYAFADFDRIRVLGAGKAGARMALALERLLSRRISDGWVNVPGPTAIQLRRIHLRRIHLHPAGHPVPDERGVEGARRIAQMARESGPRGGTHSKSARLGRRADQHAR